MCHLVSSGSDGTGHGGRDAEGDNDFVSQVGSLTFQTREMSKEIVIPVNPASVVSL